VIGLFTDSTWEIKTFKQLFNKRNAQYYHSTVPVKYRSRSLPGFSLYRHMNAGHTVFRIENIFAIYVLCSVGVGCHLHN
jgi:hypothetical protein